MRLTPLLAVLALVPLAQGSPQCPVEVLPNPDPAGWRTFGSDVDAAGDLFVISVGGLGSPDGAQVRRRGAGGVLGPPEFLEAPDPRNQRVLPVATDGEFVAIGHESANQNLGRVFVYRDGPSGFALDDVIDAPVSFTGSDFGAELAMSQGRLLISSPSESGPTANLEGAVRLYERGPGGWAIAETFRALDPGIGRRFGRGIAFDGDRIALAESGTESQVRGVSVYEEGPQGWALAAELPSAGRFTGLGLAFGEDALFVGAPNRFIAGVGERPAILVHRRIAGSWRQTQVVQSPFQPNTGFGFGMAFRNGRLAVAGSARLQSTGMGPTVVYRQLPNGALSGPSQTIENFSGAGRGFRTMAWIDADLWLGEDEGTPSAPGGAVYRVTATPLVGRVCSASVGQGGERAQLDVRSGCPTRLANDLLLRATRLPGSTFTVMVVGDTLGSQFGILNNPSANLCAQGSIGRSTPQLSTPLGEVTYPFDVEAILGPNGTSPAAAGSTWIAQVIYREAFAPIGGTTEAVLVRVE